MTTNPELSPAMHRKTGQSAKTMLQLNDLLVEVRYKSIKNVHLSVYPPHGTVRVSAPNSMALETIRLFVITKLSWIKQQQKQFQQQAREAPREYLGWESHYFRGKRYLLEITEVDARPQITLSHHKILMQIRPGSEHSKKQQVLETWYRQQLRKHLEPLIRHWEQQLGVSVASYTIRKMKTKWGSCTGATF